MSKRLTRPYARSTVRDTPSAKSQHLTVRDAPSAKRVRRAKKAGAGAAGASRERDGPRRSWRLWSPTSPRTRDATKTEPLAARGVRGPLL